MMEQKGRNGVVRTSVVPAVPLLEQNLGVVFNTLPAAKKLTRRATYRGIIDAAKELPIPSWFITYEKPFIAIRTPFLYRKIAGLYNPVRHTYYERNMHRRRKNIYRRRLLTPSETKRFVSLHELIHAYMQERGDFNKQTAFLDAIAEVRRGRMPNLHRVVMGPLWAEGVCNFAAIYTEIQLIRRGEIDPEHSAAMRYRYRMMTGKKGVRERHPQFIQALADPTQVQPDMEWIKASYAKLEKRYNRLDKKFNLAKARKKDDFSLLFQFLRGAKSIGNAREYALGYYFASGVFDALQEKGYSPEEAFHFILTHPPVILSDLIHPTEFVEQETSYKPSPRRRSSRSYLY